MNAERKYRLLVTALIAVTTLLILFAVVQGVIVYKNHQEKLHQSQAWAHQMTDRVAADISQQMEGLAKVGDDVASALSSASCSPCDIEATLRLFYLKHSEFTSLGVAFDKLSAGNQLQLYAPFIRHNSANARIERLDSFYDYLTPKALDASALTQNPEHWYNTAKTREREWLPPFFDQAISSYVIRYTAPVFSASGEKIGMVFIDVSLDWLTDQIERHDLKDNNYLSLENVYGSSLYHSLKSTRQIIRDLSLNTSSTETELETRNRLTGASAWHHQQTIPATGWVVHTTIDKRTLPTLDDKMQPHSMQLLSETNNVGWVSLFVLVALLVYSCYRLVRKRTTEQQLWADTAAYTSFFIIGIVCVWIFEYGAEPARPDKSLTLSNKAIVEQYKREHALNSLAAHDKAPTYIPVGLFIQSIEFLSATNVNITGYIWHRYQEGQDSNYEIGTVFPEAIETNISLAYEEKNQGETLKGWYFETTLRENFTPGRFPLDRQSVWIRLWHEKLGDNILLVPDFTAYDSLNTLSLPGIEKDFVLSGWSLFRSYFEIRENNYNTQFGRSNNSTGNAVPELYFNIELVRNFLNPFLAHLFPLLVVVLMLFAIVITMSTSQEKKDFLGFNAAAVVASCSALFFVALIAHVQMRNELAANSVVYLEYFYLVTYLIILLITTNAVLLSLNVQLWIIQFHDNLIPKLIYWPALSGALFICTVWTFS